MTTAVSPIRTLVCDDEPDAREGVVRLLTTDREVAVVGEARSGHEAITMIERLAPDLVFLDVQMPKLDGIAVLRRLTERGTQHTPVVIFVTAYDEYALRAFEVHAIDYLLKPFSDARFAEALAEGKERVRQRRACELGQQLASLLQGSALMPAAPPEVTRAPASRPAESGAADGQQYLEHIMVRMAKKVALVRVDDVDWIEADDYYARLHVGGKSYLIRETMQRLEEKLDPRQFVRVHRSAIVRIDRVQSLHPYFKGSHLLTLKDGTQLTLSRSRLAAFESALGARV